MSGSNSHSGTGLGGAIRKGVGLVHGSGEAIRGSFNAAADSATGDHEAAARNQNIATRGVDEMENGHYHGTGAGVTPHDTERERINRDIQGESRPVGSTNYGSHATNVGNKIDPRFDSDVDHRGTVTGSTNYGPHSTNVGNKVDPRIESEADSGAQHNRPRSANVHYPDGTRPTGQGHDSTNAGPHLTNTGNKLDPFVDSDRDHRADPQYGASNHGPHNTDLANKLDPRVDSDLDHRGPGIHNGDTGTRGFENAPREMLQTSSHEHGTGPAFDTARRQGGHGIHFSRRTSHDEPQRTDSFNGIKRFDTMPHLHHNCPDGNGKLGDDRYTTRRESKTPHAPHSSRVANILDPRVESSAPISEPHSTLNPHQNDFLNLLDPRVNQNAVKQLSSDETGLMK
ncbi:hypothetical protein P280DRAFT_504505 [Massarina eburnea CBS 473.64]|uniref:Cell surface protein n=1 Tax=Massarina eburnea CBS 473.64 TaxID=1395130 RepID=A0A6A6SCM9_9PLEO|nr:hypothetical protein P280DRAFT_504505 [Massarina eburnea CBS 473.64]